MDLQSPNLEKVIRGDVFMVIRGDVPCAGTYVVRPRELPTALYANLENFFKKFSGLVDGIRGEGRPTLRNYSQVLFF